MCVPVPGPLQPSLSLCGDSEDRLLSPDPAWPPEGSTPSLCLCSPVRESMARAAGIWQGCCGFNALLAPSPTPQEFQLHRELTIVTERFSCLCGPSAGTRVGTFLHLNDCHLLPPPSHCRHAAIPLRSQPHALPAYREPGTTARPRMRQEKQSGISNLGISGTSQNTGGFSVSVIAEAS